MDVGSQEQGDALEERLIDFAVRIIKLAEALPRTPAGSHVAGQILRSGTSPAAHYSEARGGESTADFLHKLRIALKELNETHVWLRIIHRSALVRADKLSSLLRESKELCKIFTASVKTIRNKTRPEKRQEKRDMRRASVSMENEKRKLENGK